MKRLVFLVSVIVAVSYSSQRVVVAEQFTATWCQYCPGAARAHYEIYHRSYDSLAVVAYHPSGTDPFYSTEAQVRANYYNIPGYPTSWFDGVIENVGGQRFGNNYPWFRTSFDQRIGISSPLEISLDCAYDSVADSGMVTATVENTSGSSVTGNLHFAIVENDIPFSWIGMTTLEFLMRDMLPDASGESVSIPVSDTIMRSRNFSIDATWDELNCRIVVFVQAASKEIYQGAEIAIIQEPHMEYYGASVNEISGNGNGVVEPGESIEMQVSAKNLGDGLYTSSASIYTSDPYVAITSLNPSSVSIGRGEVDTVITFSSDVDDSCPNPHSMVFELDFGSSIDTIPFVFTTRPGFSDDMESGEGDWTHGGTFDSWNITEYKSNSPTHSWYCGYEGTWIYENQSDASLVSPYFVVPPDSTLYFFHQYSLEPNYDYGFAEIDNGSEWWHTLTSVTDTQAVWIQESFPLNSYNGQTVRIRFRFMSDYGTRDEGWYVDDVQVPTEIGIEEHRSSPTLQSTFLMVSPNPCVTSIAFTFVLPAESKYQIDIYDVVGRHIRTLHGISAGRKESAHWDRKNKSGSLVGAGVYFYRFESRTINTTGKIVVR